jgi:Flp pilus assembly protein TadB
MEPFGYVIAITSMIVVLFIVTNVYWDAKSNRVYRRFERLLEAEEISQRAFVAEKLREIEGAMDYMKREIESLKKRETPLESPERIPEAEVDSMGIEEDKETMVVFGRKPKDESTP